MSYKIVRDSAGLCRGCGPNDDNWKPNVPVGGWMEISEVPVPVDLTPAEQVPAARRVLDEQERGDLKADATIMGLINQNRTEWRTWVGNNFPTLSTAERVRLGDLFWVVSVLGRYRARNGT